MPATASILISEVGPRDGLQDIRRIMPTGFKLRWVDALCAASPAQ
jgi:hydroxymethylglutaryl-CoA lyase